MNSALTSSLLAGVRYQQTDTAYRSIIRIGEQEFSPLNESFTLMIDTAARYCLGWRDLQTSISHPCPDNVQTDSKYDTCPACQKRTGFNPAFYHAATVSAGQEKLNQEPHILYLAHFGAEYVKVGISRARRGVGRLLEQGARTAIILDTFPTALVARQYEAQIAALPQLHETTSVATKLKFLQQPYDYAAGAAILSRRKNEIEQMLGCTFSTAFPQSFDAVYFSATYTAEPLTQLSSPTRISGNCVGLIGDILLLQHADHRVAMPLKQFYGYPATRKESITPLGLPPKQASLF